MQLTDYINWWEETKELGLEDVKSNEVRVYVEDSGNMVIIKNPTITSIYKKSDFTLKIKESDNTIDSITTNEINEFLTTFFKLYPTATAKELSYYVSGGALKPIGKNYVFSELINPI